MKGESSLHDGLFFPASALRNVHVVTRNTNGKKFAETLYLGLGNVDYRPTEGWYRIFIFFLLPVLRTESLAEVLIN